jgi:hypothetical protein
VGSSVLRVFAGLLASAAVSGAFVCAVAVVKPGAGPAPHWPTAKSARAVPMPLPREPIGPASSAASFTPVLTPAPAAAVVLAGTRARPRAERRTTDTVFAPADPAPTPAPAAPAQPAPTAQQQPAPAPQATSDPTPTPATRPLHPVRRAAGETVSGAARSVAATLAPVSPAAATAVQQTGDAVAGIVTGP